MKIINAFIAVALVASAAFVPSTDATEDESTKRALRGRKKTQPFKRFKKNSNAIGNLPTNKYSNKLRMAKKNGIANQYIVVLEDFINDEEIEALANRLASDSNGKRKGNAFRRALKGFTINLSQEEAAILSNSTSVKYVEQDAEVTADTVKSWGLDRIDQLNRPLDNTYTPNGDGNNVTAYILDTGILIGHNDFGGRAEWGTNTAGDDTDIDCHGHGTHGKCKIVQPHLFYHPVQIIMR